MWHILYARSSFKVCQSRFWNAIFYVRMRLRRSLRRSSTHSMSFTYSVWREDSNNRPGSVNSDRGAQYQLMLGEKRLDVTNKLQELMKLINGGEYCIPLFLDMAFYLTLGLLNFSLRLQKMWDSAANSNYYPNIIQIYLITYSTSCNQSFHHQLRNKLWFIM